MPGVDVLPEFAPDRVGGFENRHPMPARGHPHGGGQPSDAGAHHDHVAVFAHARNRVETTSGKQILNQAV